MLVFYGEELVSPHPNNKLIITLIGKSTLNILFPDKAQHALP
jgi:hypothetical protein